MVTVFRIEEGRRVMFTFDDRDLALALVEVEGMVVTDRMGRRCRPLPIRFGGWSHQKGALGAEPEQVSPGVFAYHVRRVRS